MQWFRIVLPVLLAAGVSISAAAQTQIPADSSPLNFSSRFRTAVLAQDTRQIMRITHPYSQECISEDERDYYYSMVLKDLVRVLGHQQIIEDVSVRKVDPAKLPASSAATEAAIRWPVPPEEQIIITYTKDGFENTASLYVARDRDEWKWVHACGE